MVRTLTVLPASIALMSEEMNDWMRKASQLDVFTLLRFFKTSNGPPQVFRLRIEYQGGPIWIEDFTFDILNDPLRNFPNDAWRDSQLIGMREMRSWLLSILIKYPLLDSLRYEVA